MLLLPGFSAQFGDSLRSESFKDIFFDKYFISFSTVNFGLVQSGALEADDVPLSRLFLAAASME